MKDFAASYENADKNPDLPFLWRATQWAKPGGLIALALPARVFQRTTGQPAEAWRAIMHAVTLTGLINGSDLRKTAVWQNVDMPFCLLFAQNTRSPHDHRFFFATPSYDIKAEGLAIQASGCFLS